MRWRLLGLLGSITVVAVVTTGAFVGDRSASDPRSAGGKLGNPAPPARLETIPVGTRIVGEQPPAGWSQLVLKSIPRLATGDLDTVSEQAYGTARKVRLTIMADVREARSGGQRFALERVGVGLCAETSDAGTDVVVSTTDLAGTGQTWTAKQLLVLAAAALELRRIEIVASTATFALVKVPTTFLVSGSHRRVELLYALVLDVEGGRIHTLVWSNDPGRPEQSAPEKFVELDSFPVIDCDLDVKASRIFGTIPVSWSFAMRDLPTGEATSAPTEVGAWLARATREAADPVGLERAIRRLLDR